MASDAYRSAPEHQHCPRCAGRLVEENIAMCDVLRCAGCGGMFIPSAVMTALVEPENASLRQALVADVPRVEEDGVRYLKCPRCDAIMNRTMFGRSSGVIVDVCKTDGTWFDGGELELAVAFVNSGGFERSEQQRAADRIQENDKLRAEWRSDHVASELATWRTRRGLRVSSGERAAIGGFLSWLKRG